MAQAILWETKRHEETVTFNQKRIQTLQDELSDVCQEKGMADAKLMELDQLVGQLLSVNESLVAQLSGKPLPAHRPKIKKSKKVAVPRAATMSTVAADASRVDKYSTRQHSQLVPVQMGEIEALKSMHKMYANIARTIKRSSSPARAGASSSTGKKHSSSSNSVASGGGSAGKKLNTRLSRKKAMLIDQFNEEARNSLEHPRHSHSAHSVPASYSASATPMTSSGSTAAGSVGGGGFTSSPRTNSMEVRLPKPAVSFDHNYGSSSNNDNNNSKLDMSGDFDDYYRRASHTATPSFTSSAASTSTRHVPDASNKADMQGVISALEEEFDALNNQYRKLLSNVQSTTTVGGSGGDLIRPHVSITPDSIQAQAEQIVDVIQKLHKKGEQLRTLKSSP